MATGDTLFTLLPQNFFPGSTGPQIVQRNDGLWVLAFDNTADETAYATVVMPAHYGGGGVTATAAIAADTATSGTCELELAFERHDADSHDIDTDGFAAVQDTGAVTVPGTAGQITYDDVTFTDGAQMDSVAAGEQCRISAMVDASAGTATGDIHITSIHFKET